MKKETMTIHVSKKGPYILNGDITLLMHDGSEESASGAVALCRCGGSSRKPFCDGSHTSIGFSG